MVERRRVAVTWGGVDVKSQGTLSENFQKSGGGHHTLLILAPNHQAVTCRFIIDLGPSVTQD